MSYSLDGIYNNTVWAIDSHTAALSKLQEQAAQYGAGMAPIQISNQVDQEEQIIEDIEAELSELEASG